MNLLKRTISIVSAIAISASIVISAMAAGFTDVSEQSPYYDAISYTSEAGIFSGISDTEFAPDVQLTRGMYVTLLGKVYFHIKGDFGAPSNPVAETEFLDVSPDDYYGPSVCWAWKNEIVSGYDDDIFAPNDVLTKEQAISILYRYSNFSNDNLLSGENTNILSYEDYSDISKYAIPAIQWGLENQILTDDGDKINPTEKITRAETAQYLYNYITKWFNSRQEREVTD